MGVGRPPTLATRYTLLELRGRGARGLVCRARDQKLGRDVALKVYPAARDARLEAEVIREARALAKLEHANVVGVIDFGQAGIESEGSFFEVVYLCMEFIDGRTLRTWRSERTRSTNEVLELLTAAGTGLAAAHGTALVHRDFKPENVMIDSRGRVLVVDFGLASSRGAVPEADGEVEDLFGGHAGDRLTRLGVVKGTIEYMAPEARRGSADAKSDQFSFAMTAWESLTGGLPFDVHQYEWRHPGQEEFIGARTLAPAVRAVLERGLAYFPNDRYPSMVAMLQALAVARGARHRLAIGTAAGLGLFAVASATVLAFRTPNVLELVHEGSSPGPGGSAAASIAPSDTAAPACRAAAGRWQAETNVVRTEVEKFRNLRGWYQFEIEETSEPCALRMRIAKIGSSDVGPYRRKSKYGDSISVARPLPGGGLEIGFDVDLTHGAEKLLYRFDIEIHDGRLKGDWHLSSSAPLTGFVYGQRVSGTDFDGNWPAMTVPALSLFPCASQCRVVCEDPASARRCARDRCSDARPNTITTCAPGR